ncbi:MAG: tyrosine-type recombinase/integrase [Xenococcaceae cyanobacterium]
MNQIKTNLADNPRNLCLFVLGINTGLRASELLSIRVFQVRHLKHSDTFEIKQPKTQKYRRVAVNGKVVKVVRNLLTARSLSDEDFLFLGQRGVLTVSTVSNLVKRWCRDVRLKGNYGSHTLRKTWGYWQRKNGAPLPLLMEAFGHASQKQTLDYLCIQAEEITQLYTLEL